MITLKKFTFYLACIAAILILLSWLRGRLVIVYKTREGKLYYNEIKNNPRYYAYATSNGSINPVFYIIDSTYKEDLFKYYDSVALHFNPSLNFPAKFIVLFRPVFVRETSFDSNLVEFIDFDTVCNVIVNKNFVSYIFFSLLLVFTTSSYPATQLYLTKNLS